MKKIAILIEDMYEDMELQYPWYRLKEEGFKVDLVGTDKAVVYKSTHGYPAKSDLSSSEVKAGDYDAVVIPGGYSPDRMRRCKATVDFVMEMDRRKKMVAAICHGPWMMASACDLKGRKITSFHSIKDDLINAGAEWIDAELVVDGNLITSRTPSDLIPFVSAIIENLAKEKILVNEEKPSGDVPVIQGSSSLIDEIVPLEIREWTYICPVCGYRDGFHVSYRRTGKEIAIINICPDCHSRFDPSLKVV